MSATVRKKTVAVTVGNTEVGGDAPISVQSMTNTNTADIEATVRQIIELIEAGSELVRFTVNTPEAAKATPEIARRVRDAGYSAPLIGDFHFNGHKLLKEYPECAQCLDKYRINPGNVGGGSMRDAHFSTICRIALDNGKVIRIGVNAGSLNRDLVVNKMRENQDKAEGKTAEEVINECMVLSALQSVELARSSGVPTDRIIVSCKSSSPRYLVDLHRVLSQQTDQPIHLGLTEAGMGRKGLVWSSVALGILLNEGIGDTVRVSLTPRPGGDRREEVYAACEILQALGLRAFAPTITACPGCGRTTSTVFQQLAEDTEAYVHAKMPEWRARHIGVESMTLAVMGCIVNGPGESKAANIGISLPGTGESPECPVYVDGQRISTLSGCPDELRASFRAIIDAYVYAHFPVRGE